MANFIWYNLARCYLSPTVLSSPLFRPFAPLCESVRVIKQTFDPGANHYKNKSTKGHQTKILESHNRAAASSVTRQIKWRSISSSVNNTMVAVTLCKRCFSTTLTNQMVISAIHSKGAHKMMSKNELNRNYLLPIYKQRTIVSSIQQKLLFGSSAVINENNSVSTKNLFQKLKKKLFPYANLRIGKNELGRAGTVLSTCCAHQVNAMGS